jgi:DNA-binding phage protein
MPKTTTRRQAPASVPFRAADHLRSEAEIVAYIEAMLVDGDDRVLPIALGTVREALLRLQRSCRAT